jgi:hypothetical protein
MAPRISGSIPDLRALVFHVWPRAIENLLLDRRRSARYAQKQENTGFFNNVTTV